MSDEHDNHGNSVAAWVLVGLVILGFALASVGVALVSWTWVILGVIVAIAGLVAGKVLAARGYGLSAQSESARH